MEVFLFKIVRLLFYYYRYFPSLNKGGGGGGRGEGYQVIQFKNKQTLVVKILELHTF